MFYQITSTSKQAIHQLIARRMHESEQTAYLQQLIIQIRADHPTLSCRAMYFKLRPAGIGRDNFERLCQQQGFSSINKRNLSRTTDSSGVIRFDNLLITTPLTHINQAWSSDITYFEVKGRFCFITFIIDCYSRRILGHKASGTLTTEQTTLAALQQAVKARGGKVPPQMIFHSDGGGQYYDKAFLQYTATHHMRNSMCEFAYENGKAERLNGTIKNNYLIHFNINSLEELHKSVDRAVSLYNNERPHKALKYQTPVAYENSSVILQPQTASIVPVAAPTFIQQLRDQ
jgi:transposase InsO family protein